jgi:hypothetical protein
MVEINIQGKRPVLSHRPVAPGLEPKAAEGNQDSPDPEGPL